MSFTNILTDARRLTKSDSTSFPTSEVVDSSNRAMDRITSLIRDAEGRWQWDDSNNTDLPIATTGLVTNQQDYSLDGLHYRISRAEVQDSAGNWTRLKSMDAVDVYDQALTSFLNTAGTPQYYDKVGNSLFLYPKPNFTQTASLKLYFERGPSYFTTSEDTKTPGFNPIFHRLVALWCAYDYALINILPVAKTLREEIQVMEDQLEDYYALRDPDDRIKLAIRPLNFR